MASDMWQRCKHRTLGSAFDAKASERLTPRFFPSERAMASLVLGAINRSGGQLWLVV